MQVCPARQGAKELLGSSNPRVLTRAMLGVVAGLGFDGFHGSWWL
ncbi:hypothetical protein VDG1235_4548 [Verrucomicrobiia bacterium DG1235]|nr:hypothetical protein VDG1235_4548 [Verrucomicrobiae bacterium DG1235]